MNWAVWSLVALGFVFQVLSFVDWWHRRKDYRRLQAEMERQLRERRK